MGEIEVGLREQRLARGGGQRSLRIRVAAQGDQRHPLAVERQRAQPDAHRRSLRRPRALGRFGKCQRLLRHAEPGQDHARVHEVAGVAPIAVLGDKEGCERSGRGLTGDGSDAQ